MAKYRTGITTKEIPKISLSVLLQYGLIQSGAIVKSTYGWSDGDEIVIECHYTQKNQFIRLYYTVTDQKNVEYEKYDYRIPLTFVSSNLGIGQVPYFVCPASGKLCRILYRAYSSLTWKCREAYDQTIYYESQICSKYNRYNVEYWKLEKHINKLEEATRNQTYYNGKLTRRFKRLERLRDKQRRANCLRWQPEYLPKSVSKLIK